MKPKLQDRGGVCCRNAAVGRGGCKGSRREEDCGGEEEGGREIGRREKEQVKRVRAVALEKYAEEQRKEKERAAKELAKRREWVASTASWQSRVSIPQQPMGLKTKIYKLTSDVVHDSSEEEVKKQDTGIATPQVLHSCKAKSLLRLHNLYSI
ncbi:hypothetical protein F5050DRAFT_1813433 [Lentinula boryana]|uniref:Uncharacterized protein n=1 Tax=Lentinula boryana TaxID=40481 RepID=A0ABQ8PWT3_9AGAR|nr:hypothetical protein F5050DRAFT_1813433 [Lentinula boryana]